MKKNKLGVKLYINDPRVVYSGIEHTNGLSFNMNNILKERIIDAYEYGISLTIKRK